MKKIIITACIAALPVIGFSQKSVDEKSVPEKYQTDFKSRYPEAKQSKWNQIDSITYEVSFSNNGNKTSLTFTNVAIDTRWNVEIKYIPTTILSYMEAHYKNSKIETACILDASRKKTYEVVVKEKKEATLLNFELDGKFIDAKKIDKKASKTAKKAK